MAFSVDQQHAILPLPGFYSSVRLKVCLVSVSKTIPLVKVITNAIDVIYIYI